MGEVVYICDDDDAVVDEEDKRKLNALASVDDREIPKIPPKKSVSVDFSAIFKEKRKNGDGKDVVAFEKGRP